MLPYSVLSRGYDELYGEEQATKYRVALSVTRGVHSSVLDLGCGTGLLSRWLRCCFLVGLDPCIEFLRVARERGYEVVGGVGAYLPFRSECFEAVYCFTVVHQDPSMVAEACRVSRNIVVVSVLRKVAWLTKAVMDALLKWGRVVVLDEEGVKDVVVVATRGSREEAARCWGNRSSGR